jgi:hypothetical protein
LLFLQCLLNEELLEFFVHEVNAKLFKSVSIENLESNKVKLTGARGGRIRIIPENVQDSNNVLIGSLIELEGDIHTLDKPVEHTVVDGLCECISGRRRLSET